MGPRSPGHRPRPDPHAGRPGRHRPLHPGRSLRPGPAGSVAAVAGITVGLILVTLDDLATKGITKAWTTAPAADQATALQLVLAEETINFTLAALFNILFAGVTFILYGLAVAWSQTYPRWLGWIAVVAGAGSILAGQIQAAAGEPTTITRVLTIVFPTVITLWLVEMNILVLRKAPALERAITPVRRR